MIKPDKTYIRSSEHIFCIIYEYMCVLTCVWKATRKCSSIVRLGHNKFKKLSHIFGWNHDNNLSLGAPLVHFSYGPQATLCVFFARPYSAIAEHKIRLHVYFINSLLESGRRLKHTFSQFDRTILDEKWLWSSVRMSKPVGEWTFRWEIFRYIINVYVET